MAMSNMFNPAHPGEVLKEYIPADMTIGQAAETLAITRLTLSKILNARSGITAGMAMRLAKWLDTTPDYWLNMQVQWELAQARKEGIPKIKPLNRVTTR
jgi:addiction module HigA family antidote